MNVERQVEKLESTIKMLVQKIDNLEMRLIQLEQPEITFEENLPVGDLIAVVDTDSTSFEETSSKIMSHMGRSFLVLSGAFVLRTLTDSGTLPQHLGVTLGLLYAFTWIIMSDRLGVQGKKNNASFHGCTAIIIAYPMIYETTVGLHIISPLTSCIITTLFTGSALFISWRRDLRLLAIAFTLAALGISLAIIVSTGAIQIFSIFLISLGGVTIWFRHSKNWNSMCWVVAFIADLIVFTLVTIASDPGNLPDQYSHLTVQGAQIIALFLVFTYLGAFIIRTILFNYSVKTFTLIQSLLVILVGLGGAIQLDWLSQITLGICALLLSAIFYYISSTFLDRESEESRNFYYYIWLALLLCFIGTWLTLGTKALALVWCVLAMLTAYLGGHFNRFSLRLQSMFFVAAAFWVIGLFNAFIGAFTRLSDYPWKLYDFFALTVLGLIITTNLILITTQKDKLGQRFKNLPRLIISIYCLMGVMMIIVSLLVSVIGDGNATSVALIATLRTVVLSGSAIGLAVLVKRKWCSELDLLVYPVLGLSGIKLLMEDLPSGSPGLLALSFISFGVALIIVPQLLKKKRPKAIAVDPNIEA